MASNMDAIPSASFHIHFQQEESTALNDTESLSTGFCWSNLFRNPTIVSGYPILHRTKSNTGLDISVACMAKLMDADQIFQLAGRIILKGFCSMLVATEVAKDVVMWHLLYNDSGERISFCDERLDVFDVSKARDVSLGALESRRHIVGWCGSIQEYTGKFWNHHEEKTIVYFFCMCRSSDNISLMCNRRPSAGQSGNSPIKSSRTCQVLRYREDIRRRRIKSHWRPDYVSRY
jgi:hypothetical protein